MKPVSSLGAVKVEMTSVVLGSLEDSSFSVFCRKTGQLQESEPLVLKISLYLSKSKKKIAIQTRKELGQIMLPLLRSILSSTVETRYTQSVSETSLVGGHTGGW